MYHVLIRAHTLSVVRNPHSPRVHAVYLDVSKVWRGIGDWETSS